MIITGLSLSRIWRRRLPIGFGKPLTIDVVSAKQEELT